MSLLGKCPRCGEVIDVDLGGVYIVTITDPFTGEDFDDAYCMPCGYVELGDPGTAAGGRRD